MSTSSAACQGVKELSFTVTGTLPEWSFLEGVTMELAVAHGLGNARQVMESIKSGAKHYHFVEIMTCPGGCIGGGGQPRLTTNKVRQARISAIYKEDEGKKLRKSHDNRRSSRYTANFSLRRWARKSHHLLHTGYTKRERV